MDPEDIPDDSQVANFELSDTERDAIRRAWVALRMVYSVAEITSGTFAQFWPRYWQWVRFFHRHYDVLAWMDVDELYESLLCLDMLAFLSRFRKFSQAIQIMLTTPISVYDYQDLVLPPCP